MTVVLVIIGIALLILVHEFGHFIAAKLFNVKVEEFGIGFPPRIASVKIGETRYSINVLPFGGFVRILGKDRDAPVPELERQRSFSYQPAWRRMIIIVSAVVMNFVLGWVIIAAIFMIGIPKSIVVTDVIPNSPAAGVGIQIGDRILNFSDPDEFIDFVQQNKGREIGLNLKRSDKELDFKLRPRLEAPSGEGPLGIAFAQAGVDQKPVFSAIAEGFTASLAVIGSIFAGFYNLLVSLFSEGRLAAGFVGPIGIFGIASQAASQGLIYFVQLLGLISLNLFVLNILPFPALDGGWLLFTIIEKIKGRPISPNFEKSVNAAGFFILLLLMIAITVRDVVRLLY